MQCLLSESVDDNLQDFHAINIRFMNLTNLAPYFQDVAKYKLGDPSTFHYLNQTNYYKVSIIDDAREYLETRNAMDVVGISPEEHVFLATGVICTL
jgi:hypothetical protein